jgi:hypothetical protein
VLLIETGTRSVLVLGDADVAATHAALASAPLQPRIVVAPRSVSVTDAALGAMPQPQWLLFSQSLGALETASFRHLAQSLRASGTRPLLTGALGALELSLSSDGAATLTTRRQAYLNPVWRWPATTPD